jgi:pimeloyl-ACP methyl ester carboxylesterase
VRLSLRATHLQHSSEGLATQYFEGIFMTHFVLVHGAWHDAWCWDRVIPALREYGHSATAVTLPTHSGAGAETCAATIEKALSTPADTVVVAHSAAGLVAPLAAQRAGAAELVLVAALMPLPRMSWIEQRAASGSEQHTAFFLEREPHILTDESGALFWRPADAAEVFYNDCNPVDAQRATQRLRSQDRTIFTECAPITEAPSIPTRYVLCSRDQAISPEWATHTAHEQFNAQIEEFDASHSPFWSRPADFAALLSDSRVRH